MRGRVLRARPTIRQPALCKARVRMRGAEDPPPSLDHVLQDGNGFEQVVACGEKRVASTEGSIKTQVVTGAPRVQQGVS